jgi:CRISPR-associated protein Cmr5
VKGHEEPRSAGAEPARTVEQRRAAHAMARVPPEKAGDELRKRYRAYVDRLGPAILMNGLGQALATERAAAGAKRDRPEGQAHDLLYKNVESWLCRGEGVYAPPGDLLAAIVGGSEALYLQAQAEALAWLVWHKKFCRAYLPVSDERDGED